MFLQQLPRTLRRKVLVGLTDLRSITLVLVRLDLDVQGAESLSFEMSAQLPDVKRTLLQLLSCEPQRWFVELLDLGPSIQVVGLLGSGATSHVYEAFDNGQQVIALILSYVAVLTKWPLSLRSIAVQHVISHDHMESCMWLYLSCQPSQFVATAAV